MTHQDLGKEFCRQVENLMQKNYPKAAGITPAEFLQLIEPLREKIVKLVSLAWI